MLSITTITEQRLHGLDSGRCLITFEKTPTASQQVAHIVVRKTSTTDLDSIQKMWKASALNLDSTKNLVTLRADWCLSYDHGDWAFVPAEDILRKILKYKASSFDKPYPEFDLHELRDYVFVPLPTLRQHYILRQTKEFDEDEGEGEGEDDDERDDEGEPESENEGENEDRERGGRRAETSRRGREDEEDVIDIEDGNATIHITPFLGFPLLKHHAHPFFVIYNALPKLRKHQLLLHPEHCALLIFMNKIEAIWISRLSKAPFSSKLGKRCRPSGDDDDDAPDNQPKRKSRGGPQRGNSGLPGADRRKTRETRDTADVNKGKGKARGLGETTPVQPQKSQYLPPTPTSQSSAAKALRTRDKFLFDDISEVAAGPPEDADETVIWSDEEPVRKPGTGGMYKQPKQQARFCSSDWAMYLLSLPLWMPPYKK